MQFVEPTQSEPKIQSFSGFLAEKARCPPLSSQKAEAGGARKTRGGASKTSHCFIPEAPGPPRCLPIHPWLLAFNEQNDCFALCLIITHDGREVRATTRVKWNLSLCVDRQEFRRWRPWPSTSGSAKMDWVWVGTLRTQHSKARSGKDEGTWLLGTICGWPSQC